MRTSAELVEDGYLWEEKCLVFAVYAAGEVKVLGIHEIAFVEEACVAQRADAQEHETTGKAGYIEHVPVSGVGQLVSLVALGKHAFGQEHAAEHVYRSGQQFGKGLDVAVQKQDLGHYLAYLAVLLHIFPDGGYDVRGEPYIGVDYQMVLAALFHGQAYGTVVATAIAGIVFVEVFYLEAPLYVGTDVLVAMHVLLQFLPQGEDLVAVVYDPDFADGRCYDGSQDGLYVQEMIIVCDYAGTYHDGL